LTADNSVASQVLVPGAPTQVLHYNVSLANLITPVPLGSPPYTGFQVTDTGVYKLLYSAQLLGTGNGKLAIWLVVNGSPVANSATITAFKNGDESIIVCEYIVGLNAGDVWGFECEAQTASCNLEVIPPTVTVPLAPAIITNAYRLR
jgi:hypothetical protein